MLFKKQIRVRMDAKLEAIVKRAAKRSGMRLDEYIRHALRSGLGLKRERPVLFIVP